jgi:nicotinamidase-related amidase
VRLVERAPEHAIFTRFIPPASPDDAGGTWRRYYTRWRDMTLERIDLPLVELTPSLARFAPPARIIDKGVYSPWVDGELQRELVRLNVDTVIVSGTETEVCVLATVLGAVDRGYRTIIVTDAVCSSADGPHDAMMEVYHSRFGMQVETVVTSEIIEAIG